MFGQRNACQNSHENIRGGKSAKVDLLSLLLKRQAESVSLGDADGDTALHHVAQATELEVWFFMSCRVMRFGGIFGWPS